MKGSIAVMKGVRACIVYLLHGEIVKEESTIVSNSGIVLGFDIFD